MKDESARPKAEPPEWDLDNNDITLAADKAFDQSNIEQDDLEDAARAFAENLFINGLGAKATHLKLYDGETCLGGWSEKVIADLTLTFARQQRREAVAEFVRKVEDYADHFGDGTQQGFVRDALEAGKKF